MNEFNLDGLLEDGFELEEELDKSLNFDVYDDGAIQINEVFEGKDLIEYLNNDYGYILHSVNKKDFKWNIIFLKSDIFGWDGKGKLKKKLIPEKYKRILTPLDLVRKASSKKVLIHLGIDNILPDSEHKLRFTSADGTLTVGEKPNSVILDYKKVKSIKKNPRTHVTQYDLAVMLVDQPDDLASILSKHTRYKTDQGFRDETKRIARSIKRDMDSVSDDG